MRFGIIGIGYIAERHLKCIKAVGGELVAAYDINDSVGVLDSYFPHAKFCTSEDEFFSYDFDYTVICTPNHLHKRHILKSKGQVICEKPMVIHYEDLQDIGDNVNSILQLRYNDQIHKLEGAKKVKVEYKSPRGDWYYKSWKGDRKKSGGIEMNIGIHLFDLLLYKLGDYKHISLDRSGNSVCGKAFFGEALVEWSLSTDLGEKKRLIECDNGAIDLSVSFENLHLRSYQEILKGNGWKAKDCEVIRLINFFNSNNL